MNTEERQRKKLIELVKEEIRFNPKDKDYQNILEDLKNDKYKIEAKEDVIAPEIKNAWISAFKQMGFFPENLNKIKKSDYDKAMEFALRFFDLTKANNKFFKIISEMKFTDSNDFKPFIEAHNRKIAEIHLDMSDMIDNLNLFREDEKYAD